MKGNGKHESRKVISCVVQVLLKAGNLFPVRFK